MQCLVPQLWQWHNIIQITMYFVVCIIMKYIKFYLYLINKLFEHWFILAAVSLSVPAIVMLNYKFVGSINYNVMYNSTCILFNIINIIFMHAFYYCLISVIIHQVLVFKPMNLKWFAIIWLFIIHASLTKFSIILKLLLSAAGTNRTNVLKWCCLLLKLV